MTLGESGAGETHQDFLKSATEGLRAFLAGPDGYPCSLDPGEPAEGVEEPGLADALFPFDHHAVNSSFSYGLEGLKEDIELFLSTDVLRTHEGC
jgi:hypothetical protein